jgi:serine protease Do
VKNETTVALLATLFAFGTSTVACSRAGLGIRPEAPADIDSNSPILLRAGALGLKGKSQDAVCVQAEVTVSDVPLSSRLIRRVAEQVSAGVVSIYTKTETPYTFKLLPGSSGRRFTVPGQALGSGFFIHQSGYLLTNNHVIENASEITIRTKAGQDFGAEIIARDPVLDLAILKVQGASESFLALPMGDSAEIAVGDFVLAVGNPLGLGHTVTHGIISQTGRNLEDADPTAPGRHPEFLQTDTAINPGSSGGPLLTLSGAWIGVNTATLIGTEGISFAVPSRQVKTFIEAVLKGEGQSE